MTDELRWNLLQKKAQEQRVLKAFALFREHGIEPILIKGLAAGLNYPETKVRLSIDTDLAVAKNDFDAALSLCSSPDGEGLAVDLHSELRHLDTVAWDDLFANSRLVDIDGGSMRILRAEDHLRVMIVHWLTDGGSNRERLWDIYHAVANREHDFDWGRFLDIVGKNRRRWLTCTLGLAHRFLGLDLDDTPVKKDALDLPKWLVETVEKEWATDTPNIPLEVALNNPRVFAKQFIKRLRPNPIWATVQMEGSFDARTRVFYQIGNGIKRIAPSYRRIRDTIKGSSK